MLHLVSYTLLNIDLGAESMRVSQMKHGSPVSLVLTGEGRRYTPSVAAIIPTASDAPAFFSADTADKFRRSIGDLATIQRYPRNSIRFIPQLLGKNHSSKLVSYFMNRNLTMAFDEDDDHYLEFVAPPEFFAAQLFMRAIDDCKRVKVNATVDEIALVVPKFLTHHQRVSFVRAGKLATHKPFLVDTPTAIGTLFAVEKLSIFQKKTLYVAFVDIGASQVQVSIQEFRYANDQIIISEEGYAYDDRHGAYSIDAVIGRAIRKQLLKLKPDAKIDDRAEQTIVAAGRKVKHELTLQENVNLFLEDLVPGFDMDFSYSRETLKKSTKGFLQIINNTFMTAMDRAGFADAADIDRIELVGGGTRIPVVIDLITELYDGKVPVMKSLNSEEAAVIGCGYYIAAIKGGYLSTNVTFKPYDLYQYDYDEDGTIVTCRYEKNQKLPNGIKPFIRTVDLGQRGRLEVRNGIVKAPGCKHLTDSGIYRDKRYRVEHMLSAFEQIEKTEHEENAKIHEYESFLLDIREKLARDPSVVEANTAEDRNRALQLIAQHQFVMQRDQISDETELKRMKAEVESVTNPILKRGQNLSEGPVAYKKLQDYLDMVTRSVMTDWPSMGVRPKKKMLKGLSRSCHKVEKWLNEHSDMSRVTVDEVTIIYEKLRRSFEAVKNNLVNIHGSNEL